MGFSLFFAAFDVENVAAKRPDFMAKIKPFHDLKKSILNKGKFQPNDFHLAHVFPWRAIDECVDKYWGAGPKPQAAKALTSFVRLIFKVDVDASVPTLWTSLNPPTPGGFTTQSNYLRNMGIYKGLTKIGDMQSRNAEMEQEAI